MKPIIALAISLLCSAAAAQDRIPETDWEWQRSNQGRRVEGGFTRYNMEIDHPELRTKRCPPSKVIVIERVVERQPRYGLVIIGWDYHPAFNLFTPRKMWLPIE
jgi:hypothetical protein